MLSPQKSLLALLFAAASLLLLAGCGADRFNDAGCTSSEECRFDRVCSAGMCVSPEEADRTVEQDAGADAEADADTEDPEPDASAFIGRWQMMVSGTITQGMGEVEEIEEERMLVEISQSADADFVIGFEEDGLCPLKADIVGEDTFELVDEGCVVDQGNVVVTWENVEGRGGLDEGVLSFVVLAEVTGETPDAPPLEATFDLNFYDGTRL